MFINSKGRVCIDTEALIEEAKDLPDSEIDAIDERRETLRDVLNSFEARISELSPRDRRAVLALLYKRITDTVFDFHLSVLAQGSREKIRKANGRKAKLQVVRDFDAMQQDLELLYGFKL